MKRVIVLCLMLIIVSLSLVAQEDNIDYQSSQGQITAQMSPEELQILEDINESRLLSGLTHVVPNSILNQIAAAQVSSIRSRPQNNVGNTCLRNTTTLGDWLGQATYPSYPSGNYFPNMIALASSPQGNLQPDTLISFWVNNSGSIVQCANTPNLALFSNYYREVGIAHSYNRSNDYNYFVIIFASQPNALPVVVAQEPHYSSIVNTVSSRDVVLYISNEYAFPTGTMNSIGTISVMRVLDAWDPNINCPETFPDPLWEVFDPNYEYQLSVGAGEKEIYIYMCDDFGELTVTSISINYQPGAGTIFEQPTPVPGTIQAPIDIASTETYLVEQSTVQSQMATADAINLQATQTQFAVTVVAINAENEAQAISNRMTADANQANAIAIQLTSDAIQTNEASSPTVVMSDATATPGLTATDLIASATTDTQAALALTVTADARNLVQTQQSVELAQTQLAVQATADADNANGTSTVIAIQQSNLATQQAITPTATSIGVQTATPDPVTLSPEGPAAPAIDETTGLIDIIWRTGFLVVTNNQERGIGVSKLQFQGPGGSVIEFTEWRNVADQPDAADTLSPGGCLIAFVEEQPTLEILQENNIQCPDTSIYLQVAPGNAVWGITNGTEFTVRSTEGQLLATCFTRQGAPICHAPVPVDIQTPGEPALPADVQLSWTTAPPSVMLLQNISERNLDLSNLTFQRGSKSFNLYVILDSNQSLQNLNPHACIVIFPTGSELDTETAVDMISPATPCAYVVSLILNPAEFVWTPGTPFSVRGGNPIFDISCETGTITTCRFAVPR